MISRGPVVVLGQYEVLFQIMEGEAHRRIRKMTARDSVTTGLRSPSSDVLRGNGWKKLSELIGVRAVRESTVMPHGA